MTDTCIHGVPLHNDCRQCPPVPTLATAARALLEHVEAMSKSCYREWNGTEYVWDDDIWERELPDEFELVKALRETLRYEWIRA